MVLRVCKRLMSAFAVVKSWSTWPAVKNAMFSAVFLEGNELTSSLFPLLLPQ